MNPFKPLITILFISIYSTNLHAQDKLNQYKYIKISKQLDLKRKQNQFNINNLLKSYLNNYNFTAFVHGDSIHANTNPCNVLTTKINEEGFFTTKISISFIDCSGNTVYTTTEGSSRLKEFKPAYYEAFSMTLKDPNIQEHQFTGTLTTNSNKEKFNSNNSFILELKGTKYTFEETTVKDEYTVKQNNEIIGSLKKNTEHNIYSLETNTVKGTGTFDDFGNFSLTRTNPVNNAKIIDIMARVN